MNASSSPASTTYVSPLPSRSVPSRVGVVTDPLAEEITTVSEVIMPTEYVHAGVVEVPLHVPPASVHPAAQLPDVVDAQSSITASQASESPRSATAVHAAASASTEGDAVS